MDRSNFPPGHIVDRSDVKQFQYEPDEVLFRPRRTPSGFRLNRISLDERCKRRVKSGDAFMITEEALTTKGEKAMGGIYSPRFGADFFNPNIKEYSCECGNMVGAINEGKQCVDCGSIVTFAASDLSKEAYIDIAPYHILTYHGWNKMSQAIKKFDEVLTNKNKHTIDRAGNVIYQGKINILELYDVYDENFEHLTGLPKEIAFTSKIPVINASLRPLVRSGSKMTVFPINNMYQTITKLAQDLAIATMMNVDNSLEKVRTLTEIQETYNEITKEFENVVRGKGSLFKKHVVKARLDYTCRAVIASGPKLKIHEVAVPYQMMLELYMEELINTIMDIKKIDLMAATEFYMRCRNKLDREMWSIINVYLNSTEVWIMIDRNPTIKYGGILYMRVKECHKNLKNKTMLLPHNILPLQNADFDGDQETLTAQKLVIDSPYSYHHLFKKVFCPTYMIIDKATGLFNRCMGPKKDKTAILYEIFDLSRMISFMESSEARMGYNQDEPYVKKYNAIMDRATSNIGPSDSDKSDWVMSYHELLYDSGELSSRESRGPLGSNIRTTLDLSDDDATDLDHDED